MSTTQLAAIASIDSASFTSAKTTGIFARLASEALSASSFAAVRPASAHETPPGSDKKRIKFDAGTMGLTISYTLEYTIVGEELMSWVSVAGGVKSIIGSYQLTPIDETSTQVNYRLEVDAGFGVPGPVRRAVTKLVVGAALPELKRYLENKYQKA